MANITWVGGSGSWNTPADWSTGTPTDVDSVTIDIPLITVTIDGATPSTAYTLSTMGSTLSVIGGTLTTIAGASFGGAFEESSGLFVTGGTGAVFADGITMTGGTIEALAGAALTITAGGSLGGTLSGTGQLDINGGTTYIQNGFSCSLSSIVVAANLGFDTSFTTHANFSVTASGNVDLFGNKLTIAGNSVIDGTIGNGSLVDAGTLTLGAPNGTQYLDNGLTLDVLGTVVQSGNVNQGTADAGAKIVISKTGHYLINGNWTINDPNPSIGTITNAGILAKTGGGKTATINTSLSSTGTIEAETGTLLLAGPTNSLGGAVSGGGTLALGGGQTIFGPKISLKVACLDLQSGVMVLNKSLSYAGEWDMNGNAVLNLNTTGETLTLSGRSNFDTGTLSGYGGTVLISGAAQIGGGPGSVFVIGGPNTLTISGTLDQTGAISFGASSNPQADILKGATWSIEGDSNINGPYGLIDNAGTFIDPNGSGTATVASEFESTGTLTVNAATLQFQGATVLAGTVTGSGTLDLNGPATLQAGLGISVAALTIDGAAVSLGESLSYGNVFSETGNGVLDLGGHVLTLSGAISLDGGALTDFGTMIAAGATTIGHYAIDNAAMLSVTGSAEQAGSLTLNGGVLAIATTGTYIFDDDVSIGGTGAVSLAGTLVVGGAGPAAIAAFVNETGGDIVVDGQALTLSGGGTLAAAVSGTGSLNLATGTFALASAVSLTVATLNLGATANLQGQIGYGGTFLDEGTTNLGGGTLTTTGTTVLNGATFDGPGTFATSGDTTLSYLTVQQGAAVSLNGVAEQGPGNTDVNGGTLIVGASGTLTLDANQSIFGGGVLDVAGQLIAGGNGNGVLNMAITDTGLIAANLGTLDIGGGVLGSGQLSIGSTATLIFSSNSRITAATTVGFAGSNATLEIQNAVGANMSTFGATLADFATGDMIGISNINAQSAVGTLSANGLQYVVSDSNNDTLTLNFSTKEAQGSIYVGTLAGQTTIFHH